MRERIEWLLKEIKDCHEPARLASLITDFGDHVALEDTNGWYWLKRLKDMRTELFYDANQAVRESLTL